MVTKPTSDRATATGAVLVVDDDEAIREYVADALVYEGYRVETAADGAAGVAAVERRRPSLVLLDMRMPVLDGWGFARALRERGIHVPIVVMTAAANADYWCNEVGGLRALSKPFDLDDLYTAVADFAAEPPP